jgi:hypothetical protein
LRSAAQGQPLVQVGVQCVRGTASQDWPSQQCSVR